MFDALTMSILTAIVVAAFAAAVPLLLAALGEHVGESSGVLNLGIEGVMLLGGFVGFAVAFSTGVPLLGFLAAAVAGLIASIPMVVAVVLGLNQIVVGLAVYLGGLGLTSLLVEAWFPTSPRIPPGFPWILPVTFVAAGALAWWLRRTDAGLRLRAAGLNPRALDVAGVSVMRFRVASVLFGGVLSGLGGAYLSVHVVGSFTEGMTHGLGFLAIVLVMLARGRVWFLTIAALVYGFLVSFGSASQLFAVSLPTDVVAMIPFILVILVLVVSRKSSTTSSALGAAYTRSTNH